MVRQAHHKKINNAKRKLAHLWVGAFSMPGNDIETILVGTVPDEEKEGYFRSRATIEHELIAVPSLVEFCNLIVERGREKGQKLSYRLLKFENPEEIEESIYNPYAGFYHRADKKVGLL